MYAHHSILRAVLTGSQVFVWVLLFHMDFARTGNTAHAIVSVALLYALSQIVTILVTPFAAQTLRNGVILALRYGVLALAGALAVWSACFSGFFNPFADVAIVFGAVLFGAFRAFYTVPYALMRTPTHVRRVIVEVAIAFIPAGVGFALTSAGVAPSYLFAVAAVVALVSYVWVIGVPDVYERFSWSWGQVFGELIEPRERRLVLTSFAKGIEGAALLFIWPIAIFLVLGSYQLLGLTLSILFIVLILVRLLRERMRPYAPLPLVHGVAASAVWVLRAFAIEPVSVALVTVFGAIAGDTRMNDIFNHESVENSTYIDESTALKEVSHALGRFICAIVFAILVSTAPLTTAFVATFVLVALCVGIVAYYDNAELSRTRRAFL